MKWTRTERSIPIPASIREALSTLDAAGFVGYLVGGCVRDFLIQRNLFHNFSGPSGVGDYCMVTGTQN